MQLNKQDSNSDHFCHQLTRLDYSTDIKQSRQTRSSMRTVPFNSVAWHERPFLSSMWPALLPSCHTASVWPRAIRSEHRPLTSKVSLCPPLVTPRITATSVSITFDPVERQTIKSSFRRENGPHWRETLLLVHQMVTGQAGEFFGAICFRWINWYWLIGDN